MDKMSRWKQEEERVGKISDTLGKKIEEGIKPLVVALNVFRFPTDASCQGHTDWGLPIPWIDIEAPNQPEERFVGEKQIFRDIARKHGISVEEVRQANHNEAWREALTKSSEAPETLEYKAWRKANERLKIALRKLLDEFYADREVAGDAQIMIFRAAEGGFRIRPQGKHSGKGRHYKPVRKMNKEELQKAAERLPRYRQEMQEFTLFLKGKYFKGGQDEVTKY